MNIVTCPDKMPSMLAVQQVSVFNTLFNKFQYSTTCVTLIWCFHIIHPRPLLDSTWKTSHSQLNTLKRPSVKYQCLQLQDQTTLRLHYSNSGSMFFTGHWRSLTIPECYHRFTSVQMKQSWNSKGLSTFSSGVTPNQPFRQSAIHKHHNTRTGMACLTQVSIALSMVVHASAYSLHITTTLWNTWKLVTMLTSIWIVQKKRSTSWLHSVNSPVCCLGILGKVWRLIYNFAHTNHAICAVE